MTPADHEALVKRLRNRALDNRDIGRDNSADLLDEAATALESLGARPQTVTEALRNFITKIEKLTPGVNSMFQMAAIHGAKWPAGTENSWAEELAAAKAALAAAPPPTSPWQTVEPVRELQSNPNCPNCAASHSIGGTWLDGKWTDLYHMTANGFVLHHVPLPAPPTEQDKP